MKKIKITKIFRKFWRVRHFFEGIRVAVYYPYLTRSYCFVRRCYLKIKGLI